MFAGPLETINVMHNHAIIQLNQFTKLNTRWAAAIFQVHCFGNRLKIIKGFGDIPLVTDRCWKSEWYLIKNQQIRTTMYQKHIIQRGWAGTPGAAGAPPAMVGYDVIMKVYVIHRRRSRYFRLQIFIKN